MKTKILMGALAVMAMTSCSQNEVFQNEGDNLGNEISFRTMVGKQTRGAEADLDGLKAANAGFKCIGYTTTEEFASATTTPNTHFSGPITYAAGTNTWKMTPEPYWPADNLNLSVFCFYPTAVTTLGGFLSYNEPVVTASPAAVTLPALSYTIPTNIKDQVDLLAAATLNQKKASIPAPISISFKHILSQVYFTAKTANANYRVVVKNIKVEGVKNKGTYSFAGTWALGSETTNYTYMDGTTGYIETMATRINSGDGTVANDVKSLMLIPQEKVEGTFKLTVIYDIYSPSADTKLASNVTKTADMETLLQGKKYAYQLTLPIDESPAVPITFNVTVADWENSTIDMSFTTYKLAGADDATNLQDKIKDYYSSVSALTNVRTIEVKGIVTAAINIDLSTVETVNMGADDSVILDFSTVTGLSSTYKVTVTPDPHWTASPATLSAPGKIKLTKKVVAP